MYVAVSGIVCLIHSDLTPLRRLGLFTCRSPLIPILSARTNEPTNKRTSANISKKKIPFQIHLEGSIQIFLFPYGIALYIYIIRPVTTDTSKQIAKWMDNYN